MDKTLRTVLTMGILIVLAVLVLCGQAIAQPSVQLRLDPDIRMMIVGKSPKEIKLTTLTNKPGIQFIWKISGEGKLEEKTPNSGALYTLPTTLPAKSQTTITVIVTDEKGRTGEDKVTFTLIPYPEARKTPVPGQENTLETLVRKADSFFERKQYLTPPGDNAFEFYTAVLKIDPQNAHANEQIRQMLKIYKEWGDKAYETQPDSVRAKESYEKYLTIAEYLNIQDAVEDVTKRLKILTLLKEAEDVFDLDRFNFIPKAENFEMYQSNLEKALSYYKDILDVDPQNSYAQARINRIIATNVKWGDYAYRQQWYITPVGRSAFDYYKLVLKLDPQHQQAKEKIVTITESYKKKGDKECQRKKYEDARKWYELYSEVAGYVVNELQDQRIASEYQEVQKLLTTMPTPEPTKKPE
jgi:tetratricopeptide (TPR) repeat protein